ncbi:MULTISPECIES: glycosyltransferase family 2 protein [unclassified Oleiphilus]|uniref:glycosyltransferase n=1 Tax=unclassified Oleiphilus TaxID=2631174 RepID=UPI0009EF599D|nr:MULTISPECIES: glycosyltransferase [unclassified Oleiphilus]
MKNRVSIIMRCKNSDWVIGEALSALFSQEYTDFELVVVDSGSTDRTLEFVSHYPCRLIEIEPGDYYPGKVLNDAIATCDSDIIVFLNSDSVMLAPDSLSKLIDAFDDPSVSAAFGRQLPRPEAESWVRRDYAVSFPENAEDIPDWITMSLPLAAMRKTTFEQHHFYTEAWASEDTEWGNWAREAGHTVQYVPQARTMHSHNYTLKEIYGRRFVEGEADAFIYQKQPSFAKQCLATVRCCAQDMVFFIKERDWKSIPSIFPRRAVYQWAYLKGLQLGAKRRQTKTADASIGQAIVLNSVGS